MPLSDFHPAVSGWFSATLGEPTPPQRQGWPAIRTGANVLIAAPTGTGKTLSAFLCAIDALVKQGPYLTDGTHGRERLLMLALLNQELTMLEPVLQGLQSSHENTSDGPPS